jgi:hypothetical protein
MQTLMKTIQEESLQTQILEFRTKISQTGMVAQVKIQEGRGLLNELEKDNSIPAKQRFDHIKFIKFVVRKAEEALAPPAPKDPKN